MRSSRPFGLCAGAAVLAATLGGCAQPRYTNPSHPEYGAQQYDSDREQCEKANTKVTVRQGYDQVTEISVDQDAVKACLAGKGWQPASK